MRILWVLIIIGSHVKFIHYLNHILLSLFKSTSNIVIMFWLFNSQFVIHVYKSYYIIIWIMIFFLLTYFPNKSTTYFSFSFFQFSLIFIYFENNIHTFTLKYNIFHHKKVRYIQILINIIYYLKHTINKNREKIDTQIILLYVIFTYNNLYKNKITIFKISSIHFIILLLTFFTFFYFNEESKSQKEKYP